MKDFTKFLVGSIALSLMILTVTVEETAAQPYEQWIVRYDGPIHAGDSGKAIAVDDDGNVYVAGSSVGDWSSSDYPPAKR